MSALDPKYSRSNDQKHESRELSQLRSALKKTQGKLSEKHEGASELISEHIRVKNYSGLGSVRGASANRKLVNRCTSSDFQRLCRSGKTTVGLKQQPSIVLIAGEGLTNGEVAAHVPLDPIPIDAWRNRFAEEGFESIAKTVPVAPQ